VGITFRESPKGSGKWYVVVHNKGKRASRFAGSYAQAVELAEEMRLGLKYRGDTFFENLRRPVKVPTVAEYAEKWLAENESRLRPSTIERYRNRLRLYILPDLGHRPIDEVTYSLVKDVILQRKKSGLARNTLKTGFTPLSAMLEEAIREGLVQQNPVHRLGWILKGTEQREDTKEPFTYAERQAIEEVARNRFPEDFEFIFLLFRTGMRTGS